MTKGFACTQCAMHMQQHAARSMQTAHDSAPVTKPRVGEDHKTDSDRERERAIPRITHTAARKYGRDTLYIISIMQ